MLSGCRNVASTGTVTERDKRKQRNGREGVRVSGCMLGWMDGCVDGCVADRVDGWVDGWLIGWMDG